MLMAAGGIVGRKAHGRSKARPEGKVEMGGGLVETVLQCIAAAAAAVAMVVVWTREPKGGRS